MAGPVKLRVILSDNDARKLILPKGVPSSTEGLTQIITETFLLNGDIRLQYKDDDFGGEFINLTSVTDVQDKGTLKVIFKTTGQNQEKVKESLGSCETPESTSHSTLHKSDDSASVSSLDSDDTVLLSSPDPSPGSVQSISRSTTWPLVFPIPRFSYDSEIILGQANAEYHASGTRLSPSTKLKSHILESLAEEIIKFKAYPTDVDLNAVAEALINKHPCLREQGSYNGCYGWKISLKYKMANFRTKLRSVGCSEVSINSLKNKQQDQCHAASNIKKPRRAEVNYCPQHPKGETSDSLEKEQVQLLTEIRKRNNDKIVKEKMERTFSYRRQEVVQKKPMVAEFKTRWPALFNVDEINNEFMRITTVPLQFKFLAMLDKYSDSLMKIFHTKGGVNGQTIKNIMQPVSQSNSIDVRRECILKALCVYLNEDHVQLFKEYADCDWLSAKEAMKQTVMGIYIVRHEGHDPVDQPVDVGVVIEGTEVLSSLRNAAVAVAMLFGLIYALNLSYPRELKSTFEVIQKVFFNLDGHRLSPKVQTLKNKMLE
ncbi:uncharacterized protein LOC107677697 isoform X2 [Sinocyclocheilus anshuiensis]|nr:PREDICTED: uncharacterized protein LOC107677697 isoform X2 [Sinocyclocheilus anshuiensis]XP_016328193.1 PREDICTED: uncharacterized protein LOC107677697 isoform X2 [Sinocyclocheilus anshuiensis]